MGEYAKYGRDEIKIGTCENMYYLRADQAHLVRALSGNVDPVRDAERIRFRFPWPDEDGIAPGAFGGDFERGLAVQGVPVPLEIEHHGNWMKKGDAVCPSPERPDAGIVEIVQQRLVEGMLVLICRCAACHAAYRLPTLEDAQPIIDVLRADAGGANSFRQTVADRIEAGYTKPNRWTR